MSATVFNPTRRMELEIATERVLLGALPVVAVLGLMAFMFKIHAVAADFHSAYYPAAFRFLHGGNPYAVTHAQIVGGTAFVYPALSAIGFVPFSLFGRDFGQVAYMLCCLACIPATLRVLDVRDWRVYGAAFLWLPTYGGWQSGNLTLPLCLMVALAWRFRDRPVVAGLLTAVAISLKPFVWPLGLWLLATRRWRAAAWAFGLGALVNLLAWGVVGFDQVHAYLKLSGQVTDALWRGGYSMLSIAHHLGFGRGVGEILLVGVSALVGLAVLYQGWRGREREAIAYAVLLMLVASPLVWSHYFALLLVPFALMRPRWTPLWAMPVLMWVCPPSQAVVGWQDALAWIVTSFSLTTLLRSASGRAVASGPLPAPIPKLSASS
jgi:Glycosyltransferase family 87